VVVRTGEGREADVEEMRVCTGLLCGDGIACASWGRSDPSYALGVLDIISRRLRFKHLANASLRQWYFNNHMTLTQLGIVAVPLLCAPPSFLPSPTLCASLVTPKTRAIILVSPNNPTGAIYPKEILAEFAQLAKGRGLALVIGEVAPIGSSVRNGLLIRGSR
jgi:hypothetical protein